MRLGRSSWLGSLSALVAVVFLAPQEGWTQHPLVGAWERTDDRDRLEVLVVEEGGRAVKNKHRPDGSIRRVEIIQWSTSDAATEGAGTIKVTAEYRPDDAGNLVNQGEGLEVPVTYTVSEGGDQLTLVLARIVTEVWTKSQRTVVDPERVTAVTERSWGQVKLARP